VTINRIIIAARGLGLAVSIAPCRQRRLPAWEICREADLAPVPLYQNIAAVSVNPVMGYPSGMPPRWLFPPSSDPHVMLAIQL